MAHIPRCQVFYIPAHAQPHAQPRASGPLSTVTSPDTKRYLSQHKKVPFVMDHIPWNVHAMNIRVCCSFPDIRRLSRVGREYKWLQRAIVTAAREFNCREFSVECLGELFKSAEIKEQRLMRLTGDVPASALCFTRGGSTDVECARWWYEAQLHLHLFCQRRGFEPASVVDIARRGFEYEQVCDGAISEQVFHVVLGHVFSVFVENRTPSFAEVVREGTRRARCAKAGEPRSFRLEGRLGGRARRLEDLREPLNSSLFHNSGFVCARDLGCGNVSARAPWCEVLRTLTCLLYRESYCDPYICGCDLHEDGDDNFM